MKAVAGVVAVWVLGAVPLGSLVGRLLRAAAAGTVDASGPDANPARAEASLEAAAATGGRGSRRAP